jgi:hypothetical protein
MSCPGLRSTSLIYKRPCCKNVTCFRGARKAMSAKKAADPVSAPVRYIFRRKAGPNMTEIWCQKKVKKNQHTDPSYTSFERRNIWEKMWSVGLEPWYHIRIVLRTNQWRTLGHNSGRVNGQGRELYVLGRFWLVDGQLLRNFVLGWGRRPISPPLRSANTTNYSKRPI